MQRFGVGLEFQRIFSKSAVFYGQWLFFVLHEFGEIEQAVDQLGRCLFCHDSVFDRTDEVLLSFIIQ